MVSPATERRWCPKVSWAVGHAEAGGGLAGADRGNSPPPLLGRRLSLPVQLLLQPSVQVPPRLFPLASQHTRARAHTHTRTHTGGPCLFSKRRRCAKVWCSSVTAAFASLRSTTGGSTVLPPIPAAPPFPETDPCTFAACSPAASSWGERGGGRREWGCLPLRRYRQSTCWCARARRAQRSRGRPRPPQRHLPPAACWKPMSSAAWTPPWRCPKP